MFDKSKKAHEVLCDPHRRAIYDTMGVKGLETDGWEVVQRTKTPQEIREEYERLAQVRHYGHNELLRQFLKSCSIASYKRFLRNAKNAV